MSEKEKHKKRVLESIKSEIRPLEDGFYYWFPRTRIGAFSEYDIRIIADHLHSLNEEHEKSINEYFEKHG